MAKWTDSQQKVIDTRNKNILVSAAAGSGKTAVLVERIIKRILDKDNPVDVDKLLVVTFTNAAASEMRERILKAIDKELDNDPENEHLQRQQAYIHNSSITTIHSFCLKLIREHFADIDLDPSVRVADEGEINLLKSDVIAEVLEDYYKNGNSEFYNFVEQFSGKNNDSYLEEMVLSLFEKAMGKPWPLQWLDSCLIQYSISDENELLQSNVVKLICRYVDGICTELISKYEMIIEMCKSSGLDNYLKNFEAEIANIKCVIQASDYTQKRLKLNFIFDRLSPCKKGTYDEDTKSFVTDIRNKSKKTIEELKTKLFVDSIENEVEKIEKCKPVIKVYIDLTKQFIARFKKKKRDKNIIDFNDFEHYAIEILVKNDNGKIIPTKVADDLANYYTEVMIDEYQDSNMVQETILSSVSRERFGENNRFMVGDVKQSIYGFRGSNPNIFIEKYNAYGFEDSNNVKIVLDKNFRSRNGVIESINFIFKNIMDKDFGGVTYNNEHKLNLGADYNQMQGFSDNTEFIMIKEDEEQIDIDDENITNELEAHYIANKIRELTDPEKGMFIRDKETQEYRLAKYSDIVILMRSVTDKAEEVNDILMSEGIPSYLESRSGYFKTIEIRNIINYLTIIDNPTQDIPLAAVLKSPIVGFDDEQIAIIRSTTGKKISLYENVLLYVENEEDGISSKINSFLAQLNYFRDEVNYLSIYDLISKILVETNYYDYVKAMPSGDRRCANIDMLLEKASVYESGSYKGLFNFIRYIEKINDYNIEMGEASVLSENDNNVKIMSIHKSKGLEFPIVFLANIGKKFNFMDASKKVIIHQDFGIGFDYIDVESRIKTKNIVKAAIAKKIQLETIEEEMRLLYVACTRAKEKLIITYSGADNKKMQEMLSQRENQSYYLGYGTLAKCKSYADFITLSLGRNKSFSQVYDILGMNEPIENNLFNSKSYIDVEIILPINIITHNIEGNYERGVNTENLLNIKGSEIFSKEIHEKIMENIDYIYPYKNEVGLKAKMSVSDIKEISYDISTESNSTEKNDIIPEFLSQGELLSGADRGTAYHRIFELFDYSVDADMDSIKKMLDGFMASGLISSEQRSCLDVDEILKFAKSDIGIRMKNAYTRGELFREAQFVIGLYESEINEFKRIAGYVANGNDVIEAQQVEKTGDIVLIQGIVDAYFIENDKIIVVDYKTDKVKDDNELVKRYFVQLELYKRAVSQLTQKDVSQKIIYAVRHSKTIVL